MTNKTICLAIVLGVAVSGFADDQVHDQSVTPKEIRTVARDNAIVESLLRLPSATVVQFPQHRGVVRRYLARITDRTKFMDVLERLKAYDDLKPVAAILASVPISTESIRAARLLLENDGRNLVQSVIASSDDEQAAAALLALGYVDSPSGNELLFQVLQDEARGLRVRTAAANALGTMPNGQRELLKRLKEKRIVGLDSVIAEALLQSKVGDIREEAAKYVASPMAKADSPIPSPGELAKMRGSAANGKIVFETIGACNKCHSVTGAGKGAGPDLSEIGSKLSREELCVAIIDPSAAISHGYEAYTLLTSDGVVMTGTLVNQTDAAVTIRTSDAIEMTFARKDIDQFDKLALSLMPADLPQLMPLQGLVDLIEYLAVLRKPMERPSQQINRASSHSATTALESLDTADGVELQLFASEPMLANPTSIDVDHLGRVWVCEAINYRHFRNPGAEERDEGDRILVLEDVDLDGAADKATVFYQGKEIDSPHGVCVLGNEVIVSAGANVWVFTDEDGDLRADSKRPLFTGIQGVQHDHGIHGFTVGPDQRLYFSFGNQGKRICDPSGRLIVDEAGNAVEDTRHPYQQGMVFRSRLDGSRFETLGWNFRNNWELCIDSFGTIWQSDNDDDGYRGTRINYVMEFGNYGFRDELTGESWKVERAGIESDLPSRHWHLNDPGVVPNVLQTGAGSPAGITIYEGDLLPLTYRNQIIHCDPGFNVVRAYPVRKSGAGYSASTASLVDGTRDQWFRPVDVATAPDGSLFIADWYDAGVGGHRMGDTTLGRVYRMTTKDNKAYCIPKPDFASLDGAIKALQSPNIETRFLAQRAFQRFGSSAFPTLMQMITGHSSPRMRSRAAWQLAAIENQAETVVKELAKDADPDLRIVGIRIARQHQLDLIPICATLLEDPSPEVRRELAIALRHSRSSTMPQWWARLAAQHDGRDRWYLEALGIGSDLRADECFDAWLDLVGNDWDTPAGRDVIWRIRSPKACQYLVKIICSTDSQTDQARYFRALDFHSPADRTPALVAILTEL